MYELRDQAELRCRAREEVSPGWICPSSLGSSSSFHYNKNFNMYINDIVAERVCSM